jgi:hypothetical protein
VVGWVVASSEKIEHEELKEWVVDVTRNSVIARISMNSNTNQVGKELPVTDRAAVVWERNLSQVLT